MERWAANTLRTLGIILTSGVVIVGCLLFALLSMCAAQGGFDGGRDPSAASGYAVAAVLLGIAGISFIAWLSRGIYRSKLELASASIGSSASQVLTQEGDPTPSLPLHLSPLGRQAINRLVLALAAQIGISAVAWIFGQLRVWSARQAYLPHNWTLALLAPFVLYHLPYAILIYALLKRPDRRAFAYSLAVPAVMLLQTVFSLGIIGYNFIHNPQGLLLLVVPWLIHIAIIALAYQAIQQVGLHPEPSSLIVAAVVTFVFFTFIHIATPFLYRFAWR